ncbi:hypothetical protein [Pseudochrobactrum sp. XF203]|uniref:hypothetical protein n=1 Tax=Pseudochrobactrum sp. XF203 TaxID=2879116 RepID=UPI001CE38C8A|nr:hypothetical protein [Pseudochrobactrum sp. XF203]UCA44761.1 hypothetical protein LDL70_10265 [Pseudochrobactrum sp. XF203]
MRQIKILFSSIYEEQKFAVLSPDLHDMELEHYALKSGYVFEQTTENGMQFCAGGEAKKRHLINVLRDAGYDVIQVCEFVNYVKWGRAGATYINAGEGVLS